MSYEVTSGSLKDDFQSIKKETDELKDSYYVLIKRIEGEKNAKAILEKDVFSLNQRMDSLAQEYEVLKVKYGETQEKFQETVKNADKTEGLRRQLEQRKDIDEERLAGLEQFIRETTDAAVDSNKKCEEINRKLASIEAESSNSKKNIEQAEKSTIELQNGIKSLTTQLKALQSKVEQTDELEDKYTRTIDDLKARLESTQRRASNSDETSEKLRREVTKVKEELQQTKSYYQSLLKGSRSHEITAN